MNEAAFDAIADWYDEALRTGGLIHDILVAPLHELVGDVRGREILDLACGQGFVARLLASREARVTGIDLSSNLLAIARRYEAEQQLGITYLHGDAQRLDGVPDKAFDGVVCSMALMDIPDLEATVQAVGRVLRPGGWFVFAIAHPCYQTPRRRWLTEDDGRAAIAIGAYFEERFWRSTIPNSVRAQVGSYHRTVSTYVNTLLGHGFVLERLLEPQASGHVAARTPGYTEVPAVLLARFRLTI